MTDGVVAIIITIMVLELKAPEEGGLEALHELWPVFFAYALSFIYVAIYWNNHHHYFHLVGRVNGALLWGNLHLLFWLSLVPFATAWMGESGFAPVPVARYGVALFMNGVAYGILATLLVRLEGPDSVLARLFATTAGWWDLWWLTRWRSQPPGGCRYCRWPSMRGWR